MPSERVNERKKKVEKCFTEQQYILQRDANDRMNA